MNPISRAFFRGRLVPLAEAQVGIATHALNYGTGGFEGMVAHWNAVEGAHYLFRAREHYERLVRTCRVLCIELPFSLDDLCEITADVVRATGHPGDVYVRAVAYKSTEVIGVRLHDLEDDIYVFTVPMHETFRKAAVDCVVSSWQRFGDSVLPPQAKVTGMYVSNAVSRTQAVRDGYDEAILLNQAGFVAETCGENLFLVIDGRIVTPGVEEGILPGITRDAVIQLARNELELETTQRRVARGELYSAEECFLTGSLSGVKPVASIDRQPIGSGGSGKLTAELQRLYREAAFGRLPGYGDWTRSIHRAEEPRDASSAARAATSGP